MINCPFQKANGQIEEGVALLQTGCSGFLGNVEELLVQGHAADLDREVPDAGTVVSIILGNEFHSMFLQDQLIVQIGWVPVMDPDGFSFGGMEVEETVPQTEIEEFLPGGGELPLEMRDRWLIFGCGTSS